MQPDATTRDTRAVDIDADAPEGDARSDAHSLDARADVSRGALDAAVDAHIEDAHVDDALDAPMLRDAPGLDARTADAPRMGFGPSQCTAMRACPAGNFCTNRAPGGVCGCLPGTEACPSGTTCDVDLGACIRDCTSDLDCNAGMTCIALTGRCALRNCDAMAACPAPYICATGRCFRPDCSAGEACPSGWACDGEYCIEP
jgi:hypothetical protein